jgi:MFS family permease
MTFGKNIPLMYVFRLLVSMHFFGGVLIPFFLDWGQISFTQIMFLQSFFMISVVVLEVPTGAIADFFGRKTSVVLGAAATAGAVLIYASVPLYAIFFIAELFWALGFSLLSGAQDALMYDSLKCVRRERSSKEVLGRFHSCEVIGIMISAPVGSIIAHYFGLRSTMVVTVVPLLLAILIAVGLREPPRRLRERRGYLAVVKDGVRYFGSHRVLKTLTFDKVSIGALAFMLIWTIQPLLQELNVPLFFFGFVMAGLAGVQVPVLNSFHRLERFVGSKRRYILLSAVVAGIAFVGLGLNSYIPLTIVLSLIIAGFGLTRFVLFNNYLNKHIESHHRATVLSTVSMFDRLLRAAMYPFMGLLVEWSLRNTLMLIGAAIIVLALFSGVREHHLID